MVTKNAVFMRSVAFRKRLFTLILKERLLKRDFLFYFLMSKSKDWEKPIELVFQIHIR